MGQLSRATVESTRKSDRLSAALRRLQVPPRNSAIAGMSMNCLRSDRWHRDDSVLESEIDELVEFEPDDLPGIKLASTASELSRLLRRPVGVVTQPAVERTPNYIRRKEIRASAQLIYAAR